MSFLQYSTTYSMKKCSFFLEKSVKKIFAPFACAVFQIFAHPTRRRWIRHCCHILAPQLNLSSNIITFKIVFVKVLQIKHFVSKRFHTGLPQYGEVSTTLPKQYRNGDLVQCQFSRHCLRESLKLPLALQDEA